MDNIYTLSVVGLNKPNRTRCWGWWPTLEEAEKAFLEGEDFWLENGYYDHCIIEEVGIGFNFDRKEVWYSAEYLGYNEEKEIKYRIQKLDQSPCPNVINWSMG